MSYLIITKDILTNNYNLHEDVERLYGSDDINKSTAQAMYNESSISFYSFRENDVEEDDLEMLEHFPIGIYATLHYDRYKPLEKFLEGKCINENKVRELKKIKKIFIFTVIFGDFGCD